MARADRATEWENPWGEGWVASQETAIFTLLTLFFFRFFCVKKNRGNVVSIYLAANLPAFRRTVSTKHRTLKKKKWKKTKTHFNWNWAVWCGICVHVDVDKWPWVNSHTYVTKEFLYFLKLPHMISVRNKQAKLLLELGVRVLLTSTNNIVWSNGGRSGSHTSHFMEFY